METQAKLREIISKVLQDQIGNYHTGTVKDTFIQSADRNRFLVVCTGWFKDENFYGTTQDVELRADGLVIIHADNTSEDLAEDFVEAGIPAHNIVRAYRPEEVSRLSQSMPKKLQQPRSQQRIAA